MQVVLYVQKDSQGQVKLEEQRKTLREYGLRHGWTVIAKNNEMEVIE
jgi:DNA invertase Pin-like site-specific DNA recombinase